MSQRRQARAFLDPSTDTRRNRSQANVHARYSRDIGGSSRSTALGVHEWIALDCTPRAAATFQSAAAPQSACSYSQPLDTRSLACESRQEVARGYFERGRRRSLGNPVIFHLLIRNQRYKRSLAVRAQRHRMCSIGVMCCEQLAHAFCEHVQRDRRV